jgi:capsular polysaccharide transport system permease protein
MSSSVLIEEAVMSNRRRDAVPPSAVPREITTDVVRTVGTARRRHRRLISFLLAIILPTALMAVYLYGFAADQYVTEFRFSVRHQAPLSLDVTAGGLMAEAPTGTAAAMAMINESQMVVQYLKSTQIIDDIIAAGIDLDAIYAGSDRDFWAHLRPAASVEERKRYWRRMVDPFFDLTTGIISVEVRAFRSLDAQRVATAALQLSEKLMNDISRRARADSLAYAAAQVDESEVKLKAAQAATAAFRNRHAVLFPELQATANTSTAGTVHQGLIEARTAYSTQMAQGMSKDTVQMATLRSRITAMETELQTLHGRLAKPEHGSTLDASLASILSEYNVLQVAEQIATKVYERSLMLLLDAKNVASQQSVYLATFVHPGLPEDTLYPLRWRVTLETALISFVAWCLLQLIYHGVRDHIY